MDTLTHALSGALLGRATAGNQPAIPISRRVAVGFFAGAFPDSDVLISVFSDPLTYINLHRGVTHSLPLLPLWALGLAFLFALLWRDRNAGRLRWKPYFGLVLLALLIHVMGDVITSYGTQIFAPFSAYKASIPTTFIIDPWFTGLLLVGLLGSWLWRRSRIPAMVGLTLLAGYVGFQGVQLQQAKALGQAHVQVEGLKQATVHAFPQPGSPFNWKLLVEQPETYHVAYVNLRGNESQETDQRDEGLFARLASLYQPAMQLQWHRVNRFGDEAEQALVQEAWLAPALAGFRRFAAHPALYRVERSDAATCVWFTDLRFSLGESEAIRPSPFRFGLCRAEDRTWDLYRLTEGSREPVAN